MSWPRKKTRLSRSRTPGGSRPGSDELRASFLKEEINNLTGEIHLVERNSNSSSSSPRINSFGSSSRTRLHCLRYR